MLTETDLIYLIQDQALIREQSKHEIFYFRWRKYFERNKTQIRVENRPILRTKIIKAKHQTIQEKEQGKAKK